MKDWSLIEKERNDVYNKIRSFYDRGFSSKEFDRLVTEYRKKITDFHLLKYYNRIAERFHTYAKKRDWKVKIGLVNNKPKRLHFELTEEDKQKRKEVARKNAERAAALRSAHKVGKSEWIQIFFTPMGNKR